MSDGTYRRIFLRPKNRVLVVQACGEVALQALDAVDAAQRAVDRAWARRPLRADDVVAAAEAAWRDAYEAYWQIVQDHEVPIKEFYYAMKPLERRGSR